MRLTDAFAKAVELPKDKDVSYLDADQPGFALRVYPSGGKRWMYIAKVHGKVVRKVIGDTALYTATRARGIARELAGELRQGVDRYADEKAKIAKEREAAAAKLREKLEPRLDDLIDTYLEKTKLKPTTQDFYRGLKDRVLVKFHNLRLRDITASKVQEMYEAMSESNSPLQAAKAIRFVRTIFLANGKDSPIPRNLKMVKEGVRQARLEPLGGVRVWKEANSLSDPAKRAFVGLCLLTGCRGLELKHLTHGDVDLVAGYMTLRDTKNGKDHKIYLSSQAEELLRLVMINGHPDNPVFKTKYEIHRVFGHSEYSNHDLRKAWAITATEIGVPYPVLQACLNHKTADVTLRHYAHATPSQMRKAWQDVADYYTEQRK